MTKFGFFDNFALKGANWSKIISYGKLCAKNMKYDFFELICILKGQSRILTNSAEFSISSLLMYYNFIVITEYACNQSIVSLYNYFCDEIHEI